MFDAEALKEYIPAVSKNTVEFDLRMLIHVLTAYRQDEAVFNKLQDEIEARRNRRVARPKAQNGAVPGEFNPFLAANRKVRAAPRNAVGVDEWAQAMALMAARDRVDQQRVREVEEGLRRVDLDDFVEDEADHQPIPEPVDREEE